MDNNIQSLIKFLDDKGCEHCDYCKYQDECHGIACYGGEPVEPPCCYQKPDEYLDFDIIREEMEEFDIRPIPDNIELVVPNYNSISYDLQKELYDRLLKGNNDMNKVLKLYYDRKKKEIDETYDKKVEEDFNNIDIVKKYNELIEKFEKEQEELFKNIENLDNGYLTLMGDVNCYKYRLNTLPIKDKLEIKYKDDYNKEIDSLNKLRDEVDAQLSLSDDLGYQIEVLSKYDIIDKKTNKLKA